MKITVYSRTHCAYCPMVKRFLDTRNKEYNYINLDQRPELVDEVIRKSGATTVPITIIEKDDHEKVVIGYNIPSLVRAIA